MKQQRILYSRFAAGVLAALTAAAPAVADNQAPAPVTPAPAIATSLSDQLTDIVLLQERVDRRLTVKVNINGSGPFDFMVDTGSEATALASEVNSGLALPPAGRANLQGMASIRPVDLVSISRLDIGKHMVADIAAPLLERANIGADGIIGLDTLQDFRVVLDFREPSIALQDMRTTPNTARGFEIVVRARQKSGQLLMTNALVDGIKTTVIIDTGAQMSLANLVLRDKLQRRRETEVVTRDVNGVDLIGQLSVVRMMQIASLQLNNVPLAFADSPVFAALGLNDRPVLALGMQHLRLFDRVAIDFSNKRVLFDLPRNVSAARREARHIPLQF
jgi:predicted aspartyl protease